MKYTCPKTPSMFRKCDNIFLLCNVTHLRLGLGKLFMLGIHETWTFFPPNQKELKTKIEPAFSLILYLCSFLFMIQYDGRKMDRHFEKKLIWELLNNINRWWEVGEVAVGGGRSGGGGRGGDRQGVQNLFSHCTKTSTLKLSNYRNALMLFQLSIS